MRSAYSALLFGLSISLSLTLYLLLTGLLLICFRIISRHLKATDSMTCIFCDCSDSVYKRITVRILASQELRADSTDLASMLSSERVFSA